MNSRVDFRLDSYDNFWLLEINTLPGMTETSLFPMAAKAAGLSFEDLIDKMEVALEIIHNECLKLCLEVNYRVGKTEVLLHIRGKNAKWLNIEVFNKRKSKLSFCDMQGKRHHVRVTKSYKH